MAESTADVYTREKRNVVCAIWNKVTSNLHTIDTDGSRTMRIDLSLDEQPDAQGGAMAPAPPLPTTVAKPPLAGALGPDDGSPHKAPKASSPSSRQADSPASSWLLTPIPPPQGPLQPVSATLLRGNKRKIHLVNQDLDPRCGLWVVSLHGKG